LTPLILCIESATRVCSVAIFKGEELLSIKEESSEQYIHSEKLAVFIEECISEAQLKPEDINAVAVSSGPGSYTGLRIGTATAKGFCFGLDIPLISIETLESLAYTAVSKYPEIDIYLPMIDARRLEVFTAIFDSNCNRIANTFAEEIDSESFTEFKDKKILIFGDGAEKCLNTLTHLNLAFKDVYCSARNLGKLALQRFNASDFSDLAYFEPFYLKDFVAGKPKKLL